MQKTDKNPVQPFAPLWRRALAMLYDGLLLGAILMLATLPVSAFSNGVPTGWGRHAFQFYLLTVWYLFYAWFWVHGGQTLGMRAWRLQLVGSDGAPIEWRTATLRFASALWSGLALGAGYLWMLFDPTNRAWHDRLSASYIVLLPKKRRDTVHSSLDDATHQHNRQ